MSPSNANEMLGTTALSRRFPSENRFLDSFMEEVHRFLDGEGQHHRAFAVGLVLREFVNNAIIHGNKHDRGKFVEVQVRVEPTAIVLRVSDQGNGFDWKSHLQKPVPSAAEECGRGLVIGRQYARRLQFNDTGTEVTLWLDKAENKESDEMKEPRFERSGDKVTVTLMSKLVATGAPSLQTALKAEIADGVRTVVFDLAQTTDIDSTGIGLLIAANNSLTRLGGSVQLINVSADIVKLMGSMRLIERLHITPATHGGPHG